MDGWTDERTNGRTDGQNFPPCSTSPLGPLPKNHFFNRDEATIRGPTRSDFCRVYALFIFIFMQATPMFFSAGSIADRQTLKYFYSKLKRLKEVKKR